MPKRPPAPPGQPPRFSAPTAERRRSIVVLGGRGLGLRDVYHWLLSVKWRTLFAIAAALYLALNLAFGAAFFFAGGVENAGADSFLDHFFFSVQTFATIGYGAMFPKSPLAHWLVTFESLVGLFASAMVTGMVFARFARPTAKLVWSQVACISDREGTPTFMFRVANERMNFVAEAHVRLALIREEVTVEGERIRRVHDLQLTRDTSPAFTLSWTVMHPITPGSPLYGCTVESLERQQAQILITLTGLDETLMQTIYARHGYLPADLRFGTRFVDVIGPRGSDGRVVLDYRKFDDVAPSPLNRERLGLVVGDGAE